MGMLELAGPAAVALLGPKILLSIQKPKSGEEKDDKTPLMLGAGAWWLSTQKNYRKYAPLVAVLGAMAHRRKLALSGELSTDTKNSILAESVKE